MAHITASRNVRWKGAPMREQKWADTVRSLSNKIPAQITCHNVIPGIYQCVLYFLPLIGFGSFRMRDVSDDLFDECTIAMDAILYVPYHLLEIRSTVKTGVRLKLKPKNDCWLSVRRFAHFQQNNSSANVAQPEHRMPGKKSPIKRITCF